MKTLTEFSTLTLRKAAAARAAAGGARTPQVAASAAPVATEAGTTDITITVSGEAILEPTKTTR